MRDAWDPWWGHPSYLDDDGDAAFEEAYELAQLEAQAEREHTLVDEDDLDDFAPAEAFDAV